MGCDKSKPIENYSKNLPPVELNWTRRASTNRFITKSIGSITEHYKILNVIGTTVRGTILHAEDVLSGKSRAIRQISKQSVKKPSIFFSEAAILVQLDHPNILKVFQTVETTMSYYIVFEYINGETIKKNIKKIGNEVMVSKYMRDILGALYYMHIREIAHCNLSADHILLQHNEGESVPKIIGFSDAQNLLDKRLINPKSIAYIYVSPEMLEKTFTEKTDLWSIGVIIYELLVGKLPFPSRDKNDIIKDIYNVRVDYENPNFKTLSFNAQDFIKKLLTGNPDKRISAKEALSHPWLSQTSKEYFVNYQAIQKLRTFKINSNIGRALLQYIDNKIDVQEHEIVKIFKKVDTDFDGNLNKDEIAQAFKGVGIELNNEIEAIFNNLDIDRSGFVEFSEIKIALADWDKELNSLSKVFKSEDGFIELETLKQILEGILPHEWKEFSRKGKVENDKISLECLKDYILSIIE